MRKNSKSIIETLDYTRQLLTDKNNLVLIYPHGKIQAMHNTDFQFERGLDHILKKMKNPFQVIFKVSLVDYFRATNRDRISQLPQVQRFFGNKH